MSNPGWLKEAHRRQEAGFDRLNARRPSYAIQKRKGWTYKGMEVRTFPPPGYDWDPKVVNAIHSIAPDIQPLWITYVYSSPPEEGKDNVRIETFGRHALGRVNTDPHNKLVPFPIQMPVHTSYSYWGYKIQRPNMIEWIFKGDEDPRAADLPGAYEPFGWATYHFVKRFYGHHDIKQIKQGLHVEEDVYEEALAKRQAEEAYKVDQVAKYTQKKLDQISEVELKEYMLEGAYAAPDSTPHVTVAGPTGPETVESPIQSKQGSTPSGVS